MNTPKDTDLREALRRKYANTPQMKLSLTPRPLQGERELKRKVFPLSWRGIGGGLIAASIFLFLVFRFGMEKTEQQPVVAEVVEPEIVEQPAPESSESSEISEPSEYPDNSEPSEPIKPIKPKRTRKVQEPKEEPLLAEAEPVKETPARDNREERFSDPSNPYLQATAQLQDLRSRGERLDREVVMLMQH